MLQVSGISRILGSMQLARFYNFHVTDVILVLWFEHGFDEEQVREYKFAIVFLTYTLILPLLDIG
jgi:hypothetical protein